MELFELLASAFDRQALGHAILFSVPRGEDPSVREPDFRAFRSLLMCLDRQPGQTKACGRCDSCRILAASGADGEGPVHPDLVHVRPSEDRKAYAVEDIRALLEAFSLSRSLSPNRLAWIDEADLLCANGQAGAANALLKLLEEPRPSSYLVLVTSRLDALLHTIRSRCQIFRLPAQPGIEAARELPEGWKPFENWLLAGAPVGKGPTVPADEEAFWKERDVALTESQTAFETLWLRLKADDWARFDREAGLRILDFFKAFESSLAAIRGYANPSLQWLAFRSDAKLDN